MKIDNFNWYKNGINLGLYYECGPREVGILDLKNERWNVKELPPLDDKLKKEWSINLKNVEVPKIAKDLSLNKSFVKSENHYGNLSYYGTEKELVDYLDQLIDLGIKIIGIDEQKN